MSSYWSRMLLCWLRQGLGDQRALFLGVRAVATLTTGTSAVPAPPARTTKRTLPECVASKRSFRTSAIRTSEADTAPSSPTPPSSSDKGKKGGLKPKKKKGKRPSSTAAYLQSRAAQLSRHEAAAKEANLPWRIVAARCVDFFTLRACLFWHGGWLEIHGSSTLFSSSTFHMPQYCGTSSHHHERTRGLGGCVHGNARGDRKAWQGRERDIGAKHFLTLVHALRPLCRPTWHDVHAFSSCSTPWAGLSPGAESDGPSR